MTNAEQIALYWKHVDAIEEERAAIDARLGEQADAIRAKIRALQPPMSEVDQAMLRTIRERPFGRNRNPLLGALMNADDPSKTKIGTTLRVRLPT